MVVGFCLQTGTAQAKDVEFDFYYQCVEKVVQINDPEPEGWWGHTKSFLKSGVNLVKKTWEKTVTRNLAPGEGSKRWYSDNKNIAYDVKRVKVTSEAQLLELMGAKSEADLSDGQKALLAVYRHSKSQDVKDRMKYSYRSSINVILSDTTGFDDPGKYPDIQDDFWPYSSGPTIQMSSNRYNWSGSDVSAQSTFVHEFAHSFDRTIKEFIDPYGKDGSHFANELTKPRSAFVEGWAEFNQMLDSEEKAVQMRNNASLIRLESKTKAGDYTNVEPETLTGAQLMCVECINAIIMHRMATEVDDGKNKVFKAFTDTRLLLFRDLKTLTKKFAKNNPADIATLGKIIDEQTLGKLSDKEMMAYIGKSDEAKAFLKARAEAKEAEAAASAASGTEATNTGRPLDIKVKTETSNPFSIK
jgi:hypothetical protein